MSNSPFPHKMRDNIEAAAMAILMAIGLKYFVIEAYEIPTPSMQPTLMGSKTCGIHDRILVNKATYLLREPRRFDIIVFRYPHNQSMNYVKRIVGMPGERLTIRGGDVYEVLSKEGERPRYRVIRKPHDLQEHVWKRFYTQSDDPDVKRSFHIGGARGRWSVGADGVLTAEDTGRGARTTFMPDGEPYDYYWHGYPAFLREDLEREGQIQAVPCGDLRIGITATPTAKTESASVTLLEKPRDGVRRAFQLRLDRSGSNTAKASLDFFKSAADLRSGKPTATKTLDEVAFADGAEVELVLANYDDRLEASVGGRVLERLEYTVLPSPIVGVEVALEARGTTEFGAGWLERDQLYSVPEDGETAVFTVPPKHYWMLGDNTHRSDDGRSWRQFDLWVDADNRPTSDPAKRVKTLVGNARFLWRRDPKGLDPDENPVVVPSRNKIVFTDIHGEEHVLDGAPRDLEPPGVKKPYVEHAEGGIRFVPRRFIIGRAFAIFWPANPFRWFRVGLIR